MEKFEIDKAKRFLFLSFLQALIHRIKDIKFPSSWDERDLNNIFFPEVNKLTDGAVFRALDPGGMQNSLGLDGIVSYYGLMIGVEAKKIKTKKIPDLDGLYKLLTASQKENFAKCQKSKSPFLYVLYHNDSVVLRQG